jgi:two-component system, chemotaxis family, sensor kinase CheA
MAKDPYKFFRIEAREIIDGMSKIALAIERGAADATAVDQILRLAHTLKGAARVVREPAMADQAHAIEGLLTPLRDGGQAPGPAHAGAILRSLDLLSARLAELSPAAEAPSVIAPRSPDEPAAWNPGGSDPVESDGLAEELALLGMHLQAMRRHLASLGAGRSQAASETGMRARAALTALLEDADARLREARGRADRLRLVAIASVFPALERAARDAAHAVGRAVSFHVSGGDARLDGQVLTALRGSLIHLVRNAVDHGIEPADLRAACGKPAEGRIEIRAERRGDRILVACVDDGRGMDAAALRRAAVTRGMMDEAAAARLDDAAALRLALRSGLTTAANVTQLSGRGIGMDAAHDAVSRLKGRIELTSSPGRGTTVSLDVPMSLSSFAVLSVRCGDAIVGLPLDAVRGAASIATCAPSRSAAGDSIGWQGERIRLASLADVLGGAGASAPSAAIVVADAEGAVALGVDRIIGIEELVVRSLPEAAGPVPLVAGAARDQDGLARLVLDPIALAAAARSSRATVGAATVAPRRARVLVIDDSLTTRMLEQSMLESAGYEVTVASSAEEGLVRARTAEAPFDLFVVDVEMPGMDGFSFVATTRADRDLGRTPAMLVTSLDAPEHRRRGQEAGARAYVVKSEFDQGRFLEHVRTLVDGR